MLRFGVRLSQRSLVLKHSRRSFGRKRPNLRPPSLIGNFDPENAVHIEVQSRLRDALRCTDKEAARAVGAWGHRKINRNKVEHVDFDAIAPRVALLRDELKLSDEETKEMVLRLPSLLGLELEKGLKPLLSCFRVRLKLVEDLWLRNLLLRYPAMLGLRWEDFCERQGGKQKDLTYNNHSIERLHERLDLNPKERRLANQMIVMLNQIDLEDKIEPRNRPKKTNAHTSKDFLEDDIDKAEKTAEEELLKSKGDRR